MATLPGVIGSALGLVGPVSVYCDWVRWKVWSAASISVWQHVKLSVQIRPWDTLACCWDDKEPTNKQTNLCVQEENTLILSWIEWISSFSPLGSSNTWIPFFCSGNTLVPILCSENTLIRFLFWGTPQVPLVFSPVVFREYFDSLFMYRKLEKILICSSSLQTVVYFQLGFKECFSSLFIFREYFKTILVML